MYATVAQLVERFGLNELAELLCDEEQLVTDALLQAHLDGDVSGYSAEEQSAIAAAIQRAENALSKQSVYIDSKIASRYSLPLNDPAALPVGECCLALTRAALTDDGTNISTKIKEERKHWRDWLDQLAKCDAVLPGENAVGTGGAVNGRHVGCMQSGIDWGTY